MKLLPILLLATFVAALAPVATAAAATEDAESALITEPIAITEGAPLLGFIDATVESAVAELESATESATSGNLVRYYYSTSIAINTVRAEGRAWVDATSSSYRGGGRFSLHGGGTGAFHSYSTQVRLYRNGSLRVSRSCQSLSCTASIPRNPAGTIRISSRFCADRRDDGRGTLCTPYSSVTRY